MSNLGVISLLSLFIISLCAVIFYWFSYRRTKGAVRAKNQGLMNIAMGILYLSIASIELLTLTFTSAFAYVLLGIISFLGVISIYYGWKRVHLSKSIA